MKTLIDRFGKVACSAESIYTDTDGVYRTTGFRIGSCVAGDGCYIVDGVVPVARPTREELKAERQAAVDAIKVTTQAGNTFDGDEVSQTRMSRAIVALNTGLAPSVVWVLADNTTIQATKEELTEALVLAGQAQAAIWVI